jgi:hypothetical protein
MFRLINYAGLPVVASYYENWKQISDLAWKGCPPGFARSIRSWFHKRTPQTGVFFCATIRSMVRLTTVFFLISLSILAVVHILATSLYLYWQIWWLDIPMHLLGGITVVLGFATAWNFSVPLAHKLLTWYGSLLGVFVVAVCWEVFQYLITETLKPDYVVDTLTDILCGLIGGVVGWYIVQQLETLTNFSEE